MKFLFASLVFFCAASMAESGAEAKTLTLTIPDQFCGTSAISANFDGTISIARPQLMSAGECLPVAYLKWDSYMGVCALLKSQSGGKAVEVGMPKTEYIQTKTAIKLDSSGKLEGYVENTSGARGGSLGIGVITLATCRLP